METIRNRIKGHRRVRAGELVPHEWNFRLHPEVQKSALEAVYHEVGFARSLLAYELPDGRLKFLREFLKDGPMAAQLCYEEAAKRQISEAGLRRAKARLGVLHNEPRDLLGLYLPHTWELPDAQDRREGETPAEPGNEAIELSGSAGASPSRRETQFTTPHLIGGSVDEAHKPNA